MISTVSFHIFFFNDTATTEIYTLSLHDALPISGEYLRKGSQVYIEGSLRTRKWQDKQGNDRYSTEIVGNDLQMLGGRGGGGVSGPGARAGAGGGAGASAGGGGGGGGAAGHHGARGR